MMEKVVRVKNLSKFYLATVALLHLIPVPMHVRRTTPRTGAYSPPSIKG